MMSSAALTENHSRMVRPFAVSTPRENELIDCAYTLTATGEARRRGWRMTCDLEARTKASEISAQAGCIYSVHILYRSTRFR